MRRLIQKGFLAVALTCALGAATAQEPGQQAVGRGQFAGMQRVAGVVTSVNADVISIKADDGTVYKIATTPNTRLMRGQGIPVKLSEVKAGDGVMAVGNLDAANKTLHAAFVGTTDAEQMKKLHEDLGKTFISGKVTAIDADNLRMTIQRMDGVAQTIGFDETTSFKRGARGMRDGGTAAPAEGGESITLADIKVGDNVMGPGSVKAGVFVPTQLNVATPHRTRGAGGRGEGSPAPAQPQ